MSWRRIGVMGFAVISLLLTAMACGGGSESGAGRPAGASEKGGFEPVASTWAEISAQPEEGDDAIASSATVGVLCQWFRGVNIMLSDHPGDQADSVGNWQPLAGDIEAPYHRVTLTLGELPAEPGEYAVTGLKYSVHDDVAGPFNYGWQEVQGTVLITEAAGVVEPTDNGPLAGVALAGSFDVANNRGGRFVGSFSFTAE